MVEVIVVNTPKGCYVADYKLKDAEALHDVCRYFSNNARDILDELPEGYGTYLWTGTYEYNLLTAINEFTGEFTSYNSLMF